MKSTVKYFFMADVFLGAYFGLDKFPFLLAVYFVWGVVLHSGKYNM